MAFRINHIHLKASDPRKTADWYVRAFNFKITSDETRVFGDRFVRCQSEDGGMNVNISGARTNERLGPGDASAHHGLEHFGFDSANLETDIRRLEGLGARLLEGPIQVPNGGRIAFMQAPDDVRVELIEARNIAGGSGEPFRCCWGSRHRSPRWPHDARSQAGRAGRPGAPHAPGRRRLGDHGQPDDDPHGSLSVPPALPGSVRPDGHPRAFWRHSPRVRAR